MDKLVIFATNILSIIEGNKTSLTVIFSVLTVIVGGVGKEHLIKLVNVIFDYIFVGFYKDMEYKTKFRCEIKKRKIQNKSKLKEIRFRLKQQGKKTKEIRKAIKRERSKQKKDMQQFKIDTMLKISREQL